MNLLPFNALGSTFFANRIFFQISIFLFLLLIFYFLQMTPLAYSYEQKENFNNEYFTSTKNDIFKI